MLPEELWRLNVGQYHAMIAAVLTAGDEAPFPTRQNNRSLRLSVPNEPMLAITKAARN